MRKRVIRRSPGLPARKRCRVYRQIDRILQGQGYDHRKCDVSGYLDEHGITWWAGEMTNYIHVDGSSEFYGAEESRS